MISTPADAQPTYPTLRIWIYRFLAIDEIDVITAPSLYYFVGVRQQTTWEWRGPNNLPDASDVIVDTNHTFSVTVSSVDIAIILCEDDFWTSDDSADLSSSAGGGVDDNDCPVTQSSAPDYAYVGSWNLPSASLSGDTVTNELGFFKASGEYDGSTGVDENDAAVWFLVSDDYSPPIADAGPAKTGYLSDTITFDGGGSIASPGSSIEEYAWDFTNDGSIDALGRIASTTYSSKGTFTARLRVTDSIGIVSQDTTTVTILNRPPTPDFAYSPFNPTTQQTVEFLDTSTDSDGTLQSWFWDFGDGNQSTERNPSHRFAKGGNYDVSLNVTDNDGDSAIVSKTIQILNMRPTALFSFQPTNPTVGQPVDFHDQSTDIDGTISSCNWDFGDGDSSTQENPTHSYSKAGTYDVTLTVLDDQGSSANVTVTITVLEADLLWLWIVIVIIIITVIALAIWFWIRRRRMQPSVVEPSTPVQQEPTEQVK